MGLVKYFRFLIVSLVFVEISGSDGRDYDFVLKIGILSNKTPWTLSFVDRFNEGSEFSLGPWRTEKINYEVVSSQSMGNVQSIAQFKERAQFFVKASSAGGYDPAYEAFLSVVVNSTGVANKDLKLMRLYEPNKAVYKQSSSVSEHGAATVDYKFTVQSSNAMVSIEPTNSGHITSTLSLLKCSPTVSVVSGGMHPRVIQAFTYGKDRFK